MGAMGVEVLSWDLKGSGGEDRLVQVESTVENINPP